MNILLQSDVFSCWLARLKDMRAKFAIIARLRRAEMGNFGDCKPVGEGVSEMRIHTGQGYRVYYTQEGTCIYILLVGGDKSTQQKDIAAAISMAKERRNRS
ncbi:type II toxin-antitoxin system RelE/ParE family toxin [uncultured Desulfovibrio sp.]|uniref:type II toxin-antitoxin system RelE/ParE family toxin n=1 Tax=uncultured Desulfovibrio sp. TaxID=167968 RepID=UPI002630D215|nr:type II toxin-antitoxin system RelE/ParE family toxin [uncultured Desulfovibrio sp.]